MKRYYSILWGFFLFVLTLNTQAQSIEVLKDFDKDYSISVLEQYSKYFGKWENPEVDDSFPYAVIRVNIEGSQENVLAAKKHLQLYLGQHSMVETTIHDVENALLFLVPSRVGYIILTCGEGCSPIQILSLNRLEDNVIYEGTLRYIPIDMGMTSQFFKFRVVPKNAVVFVKGNGTEAKWPVVDGIASGELAYGTYQYRVEAEHHYSEEGTITLSEKEKEKTVVLNPKFGWLTISGDNELQGAQVYIINKTTHDSIALGTTPIIAYELSPDEYILSIKKPMYADYLDTITIFENRATTLTPQLDVNYVTLTLLTNPKSEIYNDGKWLGVERWTGNLECGKYIIETRQNKHNPAYTLVEVTKQSAGKTIVLNNPTPIVGTLKIEGYPDNAMVIIDGEQRGTTPLVIKEMLIGGHDVRIKKDKYTHADYRITIEEHQVYQLEYTLTDMESLYQQALDYYEGRNGKAKDHDQAIPLFIQLAEQGHVEAQVDVAYFYQLSKNYAMAIKWYRQAADAGSARAQFSLGNFYEFGLCSLPQDNTQAAYWYRKAAEQGHEEAQYNLGACYDYGIGVTKNLSEAKKWYEKAANQGHAEAKKRLANY